MWEIPTGARLDLSEAELDTLPFGVIHLDAEGRILGYNSAESELSKRPKAEVLGKLFFEEVAPCTNVRAFKGVLEALTQAGKGSEFLDFQFQFPWGVVAVRIRLMVFGASDRLILVTRAPG
jgi:photoactive yellow protein